MEPKPAKPLIQVTDEFNRTVQLYVMPDLVTAQRFLDKLKRGLPNGQKAFLES